MKRKAMPTPTDMAKKNNTVEGVLPTKVEPLLVLTLEKGASEVDDGNDVRALNRMDSNVAVGVDILDRTTTEKVGG